MSQGIRSGTVILPPLQSPLRRPTEFNLQSCLRRTVNKMRTQPICLALILVLICPFASAQWIQTNGPYGGSITCFAVNGTNIAAGTNGGRVFLSTNSGQSWTRSSTGLTNTYILSLVFSGTNIFAGTGGPYSDGGVFLSTNNGANWIAVNSGLTNTYVMALAVNGANLFAGTANGLFLSTNNGTSWSDVAISASVSAFVVKGENTFAGDGEGVLMSTRTARIGRLLIREWQGMSSSHSPSPARIYSRE